MPQTGSAFRVRRFFARAVPAAAIVGIMTPRMSARPASTPPERIPYLIDFPFELDPNGTFLGPSDAVLSCTELNELARMFGLCRQLVQGRHLRIPGTPDGDRPLASEDFALGYQRPRAQIAVETSRGRRAYEFVPLTPVCNPIVCGDSRWTAVIQTVKEAGQDHLQCALKNGTPEHPQTVLAAWTLSNAEGTAPFIVEQSRIPLKLADAYESVRCSLTLFDRGFFGRVQADFHHPPRAAKSAPPEPTPTASPPSPEPERPAQVLAPRWTYVDRAQESVAVPLRELVAGVRKDAAIACTSAQRRVPCRIEPESRGVLIIETEGSQEQPRFELVEISVEGTAVRPVALWYGPRLTAAQQQPAPEIEIVESSPEAWSCWPTPSEEPPPILGLFWFVDGKEYRKARNQARAEIPLPRDQAHLLSCFALLFDGTQVRAALTHAELRPPEPKFTLPSPLLLFASQETSQEFSYEAWVNEPLALDCRVVTAGAEILLPNRCRLRKRKAAQANAPQVGEVTWQLSSQDIRRLERHAIIDSPDRFFPQRYDLELTLRSERNSFRTSREIRFARPNHRPEIPGIWSWPDKDGRTHCLFAVRDQDNEHLTASLRWLEDAERTLWFSSIPQKRYAPFQYPEQISSGPGAVPGLLIAEARLAQPSARCDATVSDGTLFFSARATQLANRQDMLAALERVAAEARRTPPDGGATSSISAISEEGRFRPRTPTIQDRARQPLTVLSLPPSLTSSLSLLPHLPGRNETFSCTGDGELCAFVETLAQGTRFQESLVPPLGFALLTTDSPKRGLRFLALEVRSEVEHHD